MGCMDDSMSKALECWAEKNMTGPIRRSFFDAVNISEAYLKEHRLIKGALLAEPQAQVIRLLSNLGSDRVMKFRYPAVSQFLPRAVKLIKEFMQTEAYTVLKQEQEAAATAEIRLQRKKDEEQAAKLFRLEKYNRREKRWTKMEQREERNVQAPTDEITPEEKMNYFLDGCVISLDGHIISKEQLSIMLNRCFVTFCEKNTAMTSLSLILLMSLRAVCAEQLKQTMLSWKRRFLI